MFKGWCSVRLFFLLLNSLTAMSQTGQKAFVLYLKFIKFGVFAGAIYGGVMVLRTLKLAHETPGTPGTIYPLLLASWGSYVIMGATMCAAWPVTLYSAGKLTYEHFTKKD